MRNHSHELLKMDMKKMMVRLDKILSQNEDLRKENIMLREENKTLKEKNLKLINDATWAKHPDAEY